MCIGSKYKSKILELEQTTGQLWNERNSVPQILPVSYCRCLALNDIVFFMESFHSFCRGGELFPLNTFVNIFFFFPQTCEWLKRGLKIAQMSRIRFQTCSNAFKHFFPFVLHEKNSYSANLNVSLILCLSVYLTFVYFDLSYLCLFLPLSYFCLFVDLSYVCLFVEQFFFLLRPLNKHSHKSTRMGPQFKITFLTDLWMHFFSSPSGVFLVVINHIFRQN